MLSEGTGAVIIGAAQDADRRRADALAARGAQIVYVTRAPMTASSTSKPSSSKSPGADVMRLLVEGGANIFTYFITRAIFDKIVLVYAPKILTGGDGLGLTVGRGPERIADAVRVSDMTVRRLGEDFIVEGVSIGERPAAGSGG